MVVVETRDAVLLEFLDFDNMHSKIHNKHVAIIYLNLIKIMDMLSSHRHILCNSLRSRNQTDNEIARALAEQK